MLTNHPFPSVPTASTTGGLNWHCSLGERRFRALVRASAQIVWITDADGRCIEDSPTWRAFTGVTYEEYRDAGWLNCVHPEDRVRTREVWQRAVAGKVSYDIVYRLRHVSGEWRFTRARGIPVLDPAGEVECWVGLNDDITPQRRAETALAESELLFRTLAGSVPNFIWIADANAQAYFWNDAWYEYTGLKPEDCMGVAAAQAIHEDQRQTIVDAWVKAVERGTVFDVEVPIRDREGEYRWFRARARPMRGAEGAIVRWCGVIFDIHDHRRAIDDLCLERAERERFVCALVHDLKNSFSANRAAVEELLDADLSAEERTDYLRVWRRSIAQVERMTEDLLDANRLEAGQGYALKPRQWLAAGPLILDALEGLSDRSRVDLRVPPGLRVFGNAADLGRVVQNLVSNAIKYGAPECAVTLALKRVRGQLRLTVHNWGTPIPRKDRHKIFGFLKRGATAGQRGWGIGLTLVKGIVEAQGGRIQVRSSVARGTVFTVTLPNPRPS